MTDRDDFRGGYVSTVALYGAPMPRSERVVPFPPEPLPGTVKGGFVAPGPAPPATIESAVAAMRARVAWLENELRQHAAWTDELALLKRMIAVYAEPPNESVSDEPKGG